MQTENYTKTDEHDEPLLSELDTILMEKEGLRTMEDVISLSSRYFREGKAHWKDVAIDIPSLQQYVVAICSKKPRETHNPKWYRDILEVSYLLGVEQDIIGGLIEVISANLDSAVCTEIAIFHEKAISRAEKMQKISHERWGSLMRGVETCRQLIFMLLMEAEYSKSVTVLPRGMITQTMKPFDGKHTLAAKLLAFYAIRRFRINAYAFLGIPSGESEEKGITLLKKTLTEMGAKFSNDVMTPREVPGVSRPVSKLLQSPARTPLRALNVGNVGIAIPSPLKKATKVVDKENIEPGDKFPEASICPHGLPSDVCTVTSCTARHQLRKDTSSTPAKATPRSAAKEGSFPKITVPQSTTVATQIVRQVTDKVKVLLCKNPQKGRGSYATRDIDAGEVIIAEAPVYARIVPQEGAEFSMKICSHCYTPLGSAVEELHVILEKKKEFAPVTPWSPTRPVAPDLTPATTIAMKEAEEFDNSYPILPCRNGCDHCHYCSEDCEAQHWEAEHGLICPLSFSAPEASLLSARLLSGNPLTEMLTGKDIFKSTLVCLRWVPGHFELIARLQVIRISNGLGNTMDGWMDAFRMLGLSHLSRASYLAESAYKTTKCTLAYHYMRQVFAARELPMVPFFLFNLLAGICMINTSTYQLSTSAEQFLLETETRNSATTKAMANCEDRDTVKEAVGVFPAISLINHSCLPNAVVSRQIKLIRQPKGISLSRHMIITARRFIAKNEEITLSYVGKDSFRERQIAIKARQEFECACLRCDVDQPTSTLNAEAIRL